MIGIVVVSHSRALADAAVELAQQMAGTDGPRVRVAAGTDDGGLGTDATAIARAIEEVAGDDGVLVLMDLGSAILSAEMALDLIGTSSRVVLSPAPFVEGLVAAVVAAAGGGDVDAVATEVGRAFEAKRAQLGTPGPVEPESTPRSGDSFSFEAIVRNPSGLHARPAALFARAAARYDADVRVVDLDVGSEAVAGNSLLALMALGIRPGTRVRVSATGPQARPAVDELRDLIETGFGEV
jgi:PTS hybrid protein